MSGASPSLIHPPSLPPSLPPFQSSLSRESNAAADTIVWAAPVEGKAAGKVSKDMPAGGGGERLARQFDSNGEPIEESYEKGARTSIILSQFILSKQ